MLDRGRAREFVQLLWSEPLVFAKEFDQSSHDPGIALSQSAPERPDLAFIRRPFCPRRQNKFQRLESAFNFLIGQAAITPQQHIDELVENGITPLLDMIWIGALLQKAPNELGAFSRGRRTEKFLNFCLGDRSLQKLINYFWRI